MMNVSNLPSLVGAPNPYWYRADANEICSGCGDGAPSLVHSWSECRHANGQQVFLLLCERCVVVLERAARGEPGKEVRRLMGAWVTVKVYRPRVDGEDACVLHKERRTDASLLAIWRHDRCAILCVPCVNEIAEVGRTRGGWKT